VPEVEVPVEETPVVEVPEVEVPVEETPVVEVPEVEVPVEETPVVEVPEVEVPVEETPVVEVPEVEVPVVEDNTAAEEAAQAEADRIAAEEAAQAEADRIAAEEAAQAEADKIAAEEAAQAEADRIAAEAAKAEADRLAQAAADAAEKAEESAANASTLLDNASQYLGTPYVWGGKSPSGFDCSGFVQYVFKETYGVDIGGWTGAQEHSGTKMDVSSAQAGDLYFWGSPGSTYHVAIATGNGDYIHASQPGTPLEYNSISSYFMPSFALRVN
ncbi:C40 family peptidase, partial [Fundicoccus sp. Sow4_D5]|uniref:C40 family peptidase n=1 Tax=Fundicoccus sp. Sow4_D5 TaxID=3438782 RepID=UPI003F8FCDF2